MFDIGKKYKLVIDRGEQERPTIYTLTVTSVDEKFVKGIDKDGIPRGIQIEKIIDYNEIIAREGEY